jgi:hypothetical protein
MRAGVERREDQTGDGGSATPFVIDQPQLRAQIQPN